MNSFAICFAIFALAVAQALGDCNTDAMKSQAAEIHGLYRHFEKDAYAAAWRIQAGAFKCSLEGLKYKSCVTKLYKTEEAALEAEVQKMNATLQADWSSLIAEIKECEAHAAADCDKAGIDADIADIEAQYKSMSHDCISASWAIQKGAWACVKEGPHKYMSCVRALYKTNIASIKANAKNFETAVKADVDSLETKLKACSGH